MIPMKQEWRVKDMTSVPALTSSDGGMDLLDDVESPLIEDGSPPPTSPENLARGKWAGPRPA
jgi:hypothetical protein